jgi:hypothetical protein
MQVVEPCHERVQRLLSMKPQGYYVVNVPLPKGRINVMSGVVEYVLLQPPHENVGNGGRHRCAHGSSKNLLEDVSIKAEDIVL